MSPYSSAEQAPDRGPAQAAPPRQDASQPTSAGSRRFVCERVALILTLVVSAVLRFWDLGRQSMWGDELFSVYVSSHGPFSAVARTISDTNPPLYYMLQSLMVPLLGRSEWAMRVLPAVAGVLATGVIYLAGKKLFGARTGLWAAALFAVAPLALQYAQEARMYSLLMLFSALTLLAFASLLERPDRRHAVLLGLAIAAAAYTHVYGYLVAPILAVPVLALPRLRRRVGMRVLLAYGVAAALFLPWVLVIPAQIRSVASQGGGWWIRPPENIFDDFLWNILNFAPMWMIWVRLLFGAALLAVFVGAMEPAPDKIGEGQEEAVAQTDLIWFLVAMVVLPLLAGLVVSKYVIPIHDLRNSLVVLPAVYLLVARGAMQFRRNMPILVMAGLILAALWALPAFYSDTNKGVWREAAEFLLEHRDEQRSTVLTFRYEGDDSNWDVSSNLQQYAGILGHEGEIDPGVVRGLESKVDSPTVQFPEADGPIDLPHYLESRQRVYIVSWSEFDRLGDYLTDLGGWREAEQPVEGRPSVTVWVRTSVPATATVPASGESSATPTD